MAALGSIEKYRQFVLQLAEKTRENKLEWNKSSIDDVYVTSLSGFNIQIHTEKSRTSPGADDVFISIYDEWADLKDQFSDVTIRGEPPEGYDGYYSLMNELYNNAARQASGIDEIMNTLLGAISEI